jgi:uncharacterized protein YqgQ
MATPSREYLNGIELISEQIEDIDNINVESSRKKIAAGTLTMLNNLNKRANDNELLMASLRNLLMQKIIDKPEKMSADFIVSALEKLEASTDNTAKIILSTMQPPKDGTGENLVNVIFNNVPPNMSITSGASNSGANGGLPMGGADMMKLTNINSVFETASIVMSERSKELRQKELEAAAIEVNGIVVADDSEKK